MVLLSYIIWSAIISIIIYYLFLKTLIDNVQHAVPNEPRTIHSYIPAFGFTFKFLANPFEFIQWLNQNYGNRVIVRLMSVRYIFLNDQNTFTHRIAKDPTMSLDFFNRFISNAGGIRLQCIENIEVRKLFLKQYHDYLSGEGLRIIIHRTYEELTKNFEKFSSSETMNLFDYFGEMIFDTTVKVLFGETFVRSQMDFYTSFRQFDNVLSKVIIEFPFRSLIMCSALRQRDQFIERFMHLKVNNDMSELLRARIDMTMKLDDGRIFNERDRAGHHALLVWTAVSTVIPGACWSLVDILLHPEALEAIRNEFNIKVIDRPLYEKETLNDLRILESSIYETLRRTNFSLIQRQATEHINFTCMDGTEMGVRKNDIVVYPPFLDHLNPEIYEHPYEYQYDRFSKPQNKRLPLLTFGTGTFVCPGRYWAMNHIKLLVAMLITKFDIQLLMDDDYRKKMCTRLDYRLSMFLANKGPKIDNKHQYRMRYKLRQQ